MDDHSATEAPGDYFFLYKLTWPNKTTPPTKKSRTEATRREDGARRPVAPMAFYRCRKSQLLQTLNCKKLFREKKSVVLCEAWKNKNTKNGRKRVSVLCLPSNPVWHFMCDIIFGLSRICGLQSRTCGCTLGINPHLNPIGRWEIAQMLNETFCLVTNIKLSDTFNNK